MSRPLLLDLFCGGGMASDGYLRAGWDVFGADLYPQPDYPYRFHQGDAFDWLRNPRLLRQFDAIHVSPPCQSHTRAKHLRAAQGGTSKYPDLLTPTLELLRQQDVPWVAENVPDSPGMAEAVVCCGSSFGLGVRRHRLFLSDHFDLVGTTCDHKGQGRPWGVYHVMNDQVPSGGRTALNLEHGLEVMGVKRSMPWDTLKEGFPPAYTEFIGRQMLAQL